LLVVVAELLVEDCMPEDRHQKVYWVYLEEVLEVVVVLVVAGLLVERVGLVVLLVLLVLEHSVLQ
jgi:hypothetical protein